MENSIFDDTEFLEGEILEQVIDLNKKEQEKVVEARREDVVVLPDSDMQVLSKVTVKGVTAGIDENIKPENIKLGVNILGIEGNVAPDKPDQEKTIYPSEEEQIVKADNGFELAKVIAKPVETESFEITPSTSEQVVKASDGKFIKEVVVEAIEDIESEIAEQEEKLEVLEGKVDDLPIYEPIVDDLNAQSEMVDAIMSQVDSLKDISKETLNIDKNGEYDVVDYGKVVVDAKEDLDAELDEQESELAELRNQANELSDKPQDMLQARVDATNSCNYLFYNYAGNNLDFIGNLNTSNVTNMFGMFESCVKLINLDLTHFDTSNVTEMYKMFYNCQKLKTLNLTSFNTSNCKSMNQMFDNCMALESLDLSNFDTSSCTNTSSMFNGCKKLTNIIVSDKFNTNAVTTMYAMFQNCQNLVEVPELDTSNVTNMGSMFGSCNNLTRLPQLDMSKVTSASYMFHICKTLKEIPALDTKNVTSFQTMCGSCSELETVHSIDLRSATSLSSMFSGCSKLTNLNLKNIKKSLDLKHSLLLTDDSIVNTFKELWDLTGGTSQSVSLAGASYARTEAIYVKLIDITDEMRAEDDLIDNKKPCIVCESTDEGAMTLKEYGISKNWAISM